MAEPLSDEGATWYRHLTPSGAVEAVAARCMELSEDVDAGRVPRAVLEHWLGEWTAAVQSAADAAGAHQSPGTPESPPEAAPAYSLPPIVGNGVVRERG